jgi:hypothetical protein
LWNNLSEEAKAQKLAEVKGLGKGIFGDPVLITRRKADKHGMGIHRHIKHTTALTDKQMC